LNLESWNLRIRKILTRKKSCECFYFWLGAVHTRRPQSGGVCPVRAFFGQEGRGASSDVDVCTFCSKKLWIVRNFWCVCSDKGGWEIELKFMLLLMLSIDHSTGNNLTVEVIFVWRQDRIYKVRASFDFTNLKIGYFASIFGEKQGFAKRACLKKSPSLSSAGLLALFKRRKWARKQKFLCAIANCASKN